MEFTVGCTLEYETEAALTPFVFNLEAAVSVRRRHTDSVARFVVHLTTQCQEFMDDG